jgi:hypothetical protein
MDEKLVALLQGDSAEIPDSLIRQLESNKVHQENIQNVITEVNAMIGNLKETLNLSKEDKPTDERFPPVLSSPLSDDNKKKLFGMFSEEITNKIQSVKDSAIFGIVLDMLHETITSGET